MKEILCFLSELDFTDRIIKDLIENLRCVKQRLVIEFEDCNVFKIIHAINIIDEMNALILTNKLNSPLEKTNSSRGSIFNLISFKNFVECGI